MAIIERLSKQLLSLRQYQKRIAERKFSNDYRELLFYCWMPPTIFKAVYFSTSGGPVSLCHPCFNTVTMMPTTELKSREINIFPSDNDRSS